MATLHDVLEELERGTKSGSIKWDVYYEKTSNEEVNAISFSTDVGKCTFILSADSLLINQKPLNTLPHAVDMLRALFDFIARAQGFPKRLPTEDRAIAQALQCLREHPD